MEPNIEQLIADLRAEILTIGQQTRNLMDNNEFSVDGKLGHSEMKANIMLAYRHLEDARMRLGKVMQAKDGGKSCYPK